MTKDKKIEIFRAIQSCLKDICAKDAAKDTIDMLGKIWDLYLLSSEDPRYRDAYGDAVQHLRNNFDWDDEYTFLTRFGLQNADDSVFVKFLNAVVSPDARGSKDEIERYVDADAYGHNHWSVVLKLALSESDEYKGYLVKRLNYQS